MLVRIGSPDVELSRVVDTLWLGRLWETFSTILTKSTRILMTSRQHIPLGKSIYLKTPKPETVLQLLQDINFIVNQKSVWAVKETNFPRPLAHHANRVQSKSGRLHCPINAGEAAKANRQIDQEKGGIIVTARQACARVP